MPRTVQSSLHRGGGFLQRGVFFGGQFDLDDLLGAARAQFHRNADEQAVDAVFAFEINGAGQNLLLVLQDGFHHFDCRGGRRVVGRAGLQQVHDFGAAFARAVHDGVDAVRRAAGRAGEFRRRSSSAAAAPCRRRGRRARTSARFLPIRCSSMRDERAHARGVQHAGHADHAILGEAADFEGGLHHGVERIGHHDQDRVRRML